MLWCTIPWLFFFRFVASIFGCQPHLEIWLTSMTPHFPPPRIVDSVKGWFFCCLGEEVRGLRLVGWSDMGTWWILAERAWIGWFSCYANGPSLFKQKLSEGGGLKVGFFYLGYRFRGAFGDVPCFFCCVGFQLPWRFLFVDVPAFPFWGICHLVLEVVRHLHSAWQRHVSSVHGAVVLWLKDGEGVK